MDDSARLTALQLRVGELERKVEFIMRQLNVQYEEEPLSPALAEAMNWLKKGHKIEAVKAYQQAAEVGLKEAKDAVDALEKKLGG